jgi:hypothetical protein
MQTPRLRSLVSIAIVLAIAALTVKLAIAPLYARYSADECHAAYRRAQNRADTGRVDLHPYSASGAAGRHICGEVRGQTVGVPADISALPQP